MKKKFSNEISYFSLLKSKNERKLFFYSFKIPTINKILNSIDFNFNSNDIKSAKNLFVPIINKEKSKLECYFNENDEFNIENKEIIYENIKNLFVPNEINRGKNIELYIKIPSIFNDDDGKEKKYQFLAQLILKKIFLLVQIH